MLKKTFFFITAFSFLMLGAHATNAFVGVVNFATCATESQYGKYEQEQFEKLKNQWQSLIQETEKELTALSEKCKDQDYMDSLSPEAADEIKAKQKTLNEDLMKYQNQLYQSLNQANYIFMQRMLKVISEASEMVAKDKKLDFVMTKEACFYHKPDMEITTLVIKEMDKKFEKDKKNLSENKEMPKNLPAADKVATVTEKAALVAEKTKEKKEDKKSDKKADKKEEKKSDKKSEKKK